MGIVLIAPCCVVYSGLYIYISCSPPYIRTSKSPYIPQPTSPHVSSRLLTYHTYPLHSLQPHSLASVPSPCTRAKCAFDISATLAHPTSPIHSLNSSSRIFSARSTPCCPSYCSPPSAHPSSPPPPHHSTYRESPQRHPAQPATLRPERQRLKHICAAADPAVHMHGDPARRGSHALRQRVERSRDAVELAPAVVRHDDARGAVVHGQLRVFAREHAFDPDWERCDAAQPRQIRAPVERRVLGVC